MTGTITMYRLRRDDSGIAMIITMLMIAVLTGIGLTVFTLASNSLTNARNDRVSTTALANAEAGVGQAVAYLRTSGTGGLGCAPTCGAANAWGEEPAVVDMDAFPSATVTLSSGEAYDVWFSLIEAPDYAAKVPGRYKINSIGKSREGRRRVSVEVNVAPFEFPLAVYADSVEAGGTGSIQTESMFSKGCIYKRSKITFGGVDPVYKIPAAAHSAQYITDTNGSGPTCPASDGNNIHAAGPCNGIATSSTVTGYPFDQDKQGGGLSGSDGVNCFKKGAVRYPGSDPNYAETSKIEDANDLATRYGFNIDGLTAEQLDLLRVAAQEQGFYTTSDPNVPAVLQVGNAATTYPMPVLFYDFKDAAIGSLVDLKQLSTSYGRATPLEPGSAGCIPMGVVVVIVNGDARLNSNQTLVGSIFVMGGAPGTGRVSKANGGSNVIGTLYARELDLTGNANITLDRCFLQNLPASLLGVSTDSFVEVDR